MLPDALRYLQTRTLALCRPDKNKQSALCRQSDQSLPMAGSGALLRYHADNQHNNQPNHGVDQLQLTPGFQRVFY
ncbi:hypothetical protein AJR32_017170 [Shigella sonnei]|nr:hypothetical protein AJR32_017170 [Shigella sonnei]